MGYILPGVEVYQEIISTSPPAFVPDMYTCIVGPAYEIIENESLGNLHTLDITNAFSTTLAFSVNPDRELDIPSMKATYTGLEKVSVVTGLNVAGTSVLTVNNITGISVGDKVYSLNASSQEFITDIIKIVDNGNNTYDVHLKDIVPSGYTDFAFAKDVLNKEVEVLTYDPVNNQITLTDTKALTGEFFLYYRMLRLDLAGAVNSISNVNEIEGQLGKIDPVLNPLAYGVYKALQNTITPVKYYGVDDITDIGYTSALSYLEEDLDIYAVVPLTRDPVVLTSYKTWAEQMSLPTSNKYKIVFGTMDLPEVKIIGNDFDYTYDSATNKIASTTSTFVDWGVVPGDIFIDDNGLEVEVIDVLNNQELVVQGGNSIVTPGTAGKIQRKLNKDQQAEAIKAYAESFGSSRFILVWPDVIYAGDDGKVPSYYAAAAIAGLVSGFPPQKGFTNIALAGFTGAEATNGYFRQDQLNKIAEGGVLILANASMSFPTAVYIRHQLTTDMNNAYNRELSMVKTIDYLSLYFKKYLDKFIGTYNLVDETMNAIRDTLIITGNRLKRQKISKLGPPLIDFQIITLEKVEVDRLNIVMKCEIPGPLNYIELHLQF